MATDASRKYIQFNDDERLNVHSNNYFTGKIMQDEGKSMADDSKIEIQSILRNEHGDGPDGIILNGTADVKGRTPVYRKIWKNGTTKIDAGELLRAGVNQDQIDRATVTGTGHWEWRVDMLARKDVHIYGEIDTNIEMPPVPTPVSLPTE